MRRRRTERARLDRIDEALSAVDSLEAVDAALRVLTDGADPLTDAEVRRYADLRPGHGDGSFLWTLRDHCRQALGRDAA